MSHSNISFFIPHAGCPHMCSFCNQREISGQSKPVKAEEVSEVCKKALAEVPDLSNTEIAFFGGSFTAIDRKYMTELLEAAYGFVGKDGFKGIRISTRPDCIDEEILELLREYGVTAIELGAQSMLDNVLEMNERGHTSADVKYASELIKAYGFELGLQLMVGLYGSTYDDEMETMYRIAQLNPFSVRVYPVAVLNETRLAKLYQSGEYRLFNFDMAVDICAKMLEYFENKGIKVIRMGLHSSETMEKDIIAGFYHPAFREIVESRIYRRNICSLISGNCKKFSVCVAPNCISKAVGHKKSNLLYFESIGKEVKFETDNNLKKYECVLKDCS